MDGIANVARQQQSQASTLEAQGRAVEEVSQIQSQKSQQTNEIKDKDSDIKLNSEKDVKELVAQLNKALSPMNTNLKFGVDAQDVFYVSVIEQQTNRMIRRFPAEQAQDFLPKMQEVSGLLFDSKG